MKANAKLGQAYWDSDVSVANEIALRASSLT